MVPFSKKKECIFCREKNLRTTKEMSKTTSVYKDVFYDENSSKKCDIYTDHATSSRPVVLVVHGGAWIFGCKEEMQEIASFLASKGFVAIAIEYSLSQLDKTWVQRIIVIQLLALMLFFLFLKSPPVKAMCAFLSLFLAFHTILGSLVHENRTTQHPDHVMDLARAIRWIFSHGHEYGGDPNQIFLLGHSSGAHLVSLATLNRRFLRDMPKDVIKGVVAISGPYSYWRMQESSIKHFINQSVFNITNGMPETTLLDTNDHQSRQEWAKIVDAWPIFFEYAIDEHTPPFLLLTAGMDWSLLYHARDFANMLKRRNAHVQVIHFDNTTHFSIRAHWFDQNADVGDVVHRFVSTISSHKVR
jgi:acetyl esterase/lipase